MKAEADTGGSKARGSPNVGLDVGKESVFVGLPSPGEMMTTLGRHPFEEASFEALGAASPSVLIFDPGSIFWRCCSIAPA
jgi:hypothetical protein